MRGAHFDLHYLRIETGAAHSGGVRLGLVIGKKLARRAALRNLMKRIGREAFRLARPALPDCELVLRLAKPVHDADLSDRKTRRAWRVEIDNLLARLAGEFAR